MKLLTILPALALAAACATPAVRITSVPPGATVYRLKPDGSPEAEIGKTPLSVAVSPSRGDFTLELKLPSHEPRTLFLFPYGGVPEQVTITLPPRTADVLKRQLLEEHPEVVGSLSRGLLALQGAVITGQDTVVARLEQELKADYGRLAIYHMLLGHHAYKQGQYEKARAAFRSALEIEPQNTEARRMSDILANMR